MIEVLTGLITFIITEISKRFNISTTYVIGGIIIIASVIHTILNATNPELLKELIKYAGLSFATSQALWLTYNKYYKK